MAVKKSKKKSRKPVAAARNSKPVAKKKSSAQKAETDFTSVFADLKKVMSAHARELHTTADEPRKYYLVTKSKSWRGGPMYFGAVIAGKAYVSYHLMPLYVFPDLKKSISPELKRRMQGKSCFNFRQHDEALLSELRALTKSALEAYRDQKLL
jgi:hypothetical protein